jgi:glucose-6-phosphate dehydrogenase assembly protein OpcA
MPQLLTNPEGFVPVPVPQIEKELARQLRLEQDPNGPPIQRARMSNVVVYCDDCEAASSVNDRIAAIVEVHPSRVLFLVADPAGDSGVEAAVRVRTRYVRGGTQEVGSEQVTIQASGRSMGRLPYLVRGLLIGDLPTNLWWASKTPPPLAGPILFDLAEQAQQVIYDSLGWKEPHRGISAAAAWLGRVERDSTTARWRVASDINWRRLKLWRRVIAQALDPSSVPGAIESIHEVVVEHGPHAVTQAWQLACWLASRLGWRVQARKVDLGVEISWNLQGPWGLVRLRIHRLAEGPPEIRKVAFGLALSGTLRTLTVAHDPEGERITVVPEGLAVAARTVAAKPLPPAELVGRQLTDRERDPVFVETMAIAQTLAQGVG